MNKVILMFVYMISVKIDFKSLFIMIILLMLLLVILVTCIYFYKFDIVKVHALIHSVNTHRDVHGALFFNIPLTIKRASTYIIDVLNPDYYCHSH